MSSQMYPPVNGQKYEPSSLNDVFSLDVVTVKDSLFLFATRSSIYEYELGCLLYRVRYENLWRNPDFCRTGKMYSNFSAWVYGELGFSSRKGRNLIFIVRRLMELQCDAEIIKKFMVVGWSKAYHVLRIAKDLDDANRWFEKVAKQSERQTILDVEVELKKDGDPAKKDRKTSHVDLKFKTEEDYTFFSIALGVVEKMHETKDVGEAVALMAAYYLGSRPAGGGDATLVSLPVVIESIEKAYKVKLEVKNAAAECVERKNEVDDSRVDCHVAGES